MDVAGVSRGWMKMPDVNQRVVMYSHTYTRQPACIYSISTCMYLNSSRLQDISVLSDEKAPCQSLSAFRGRSRGCVTYSWLSWCSLSWLSLLCAVTCVGSQTSPLPFHMLHVRSSCLKNKQQVASVLIIHVLGERKGFMWGNEMALAPASPWN